MKICGEKIILVLVYDQLRQQVNLYIDDMISIFRNIWKGEQIIVWQFNRKQVLQLNVLILVRLKKISNLQQRQGILPIDWEEF